ncbi:MAG: FAD-dependent oxidoreductase [Lentisphaerae bacterium]|nr:FAD-dependent oxidoreductase [Lentisphaerota bacterium]
MDSSTRTRIAILGSGFGAFSFLKQLDPEAFDVVLISPRNHFLFTPLLPSTTVGTIEFRSIIEPVRTAQPNIRFYLAECEGIDPAGSAIHCKGSLDGRRFSLPYDTLLVAVGAENNTYGIPGVEKYALFLKEIADARTIRQRIIACFEEACAPGLAEDERARLLHFVIVGGGPTGIEFAAELNDFLKDLRRSYTTVINDVRITLLEASDAILHVFDQKLREYTAQRFHRKRIKVRTASRVKEIRERDILLQNGESLPYGLVLWSTGIGPRPLVRALPFAKDRAGRLLTDEYLRVKGTSHVFAIGDCAIIEGKAFPATAQVAQREGLYLARTLNRRARGRPEKPFQYVHMGMLAYIGGHRALADFRGVQSKGFGAWIFWRSAYITKLVSFKNKLLVIFDWLKTAIFGRDISRF